MKNFFLSTVILLGLGFPLTGCNKAPATNNAASHLPPQAPGRVSGPKGEPPNLDSERTIEEIIRATPPDLIKRQACEPVEEVDIRVSKSPLPVRVSFDSKGSFAPCGKIVKYRWDFGDGTKEVGRRASHVYTKAGSYSVSLFLTDSKGNHTLIPSQYQIIVPVYYSIGGTITDRDGESIEGVVVRVSGKPALPLITDRKGNFKLVKAESGYNYILTPMKKGYRFSPPELRVNNTSKSADFTGEQESPQF